MGTITDYGYQELTYMDMPYMAGIFGDGMGMQVKVAPFHKVGMQVATHISGTPLHGGMQAKQGGLRHATLEVYLEGDYMVDSYLAERMVGFLGMQVNQILARRQGQQAVMVLYNNTQLRFMYHFPSRGTVALGGNNWSANSTQAGDFLPKNVNTDIVEQVYRSDFGSAANVVLVCDTGEVAGVSIDTLAILGHNITTSATVQLQGSTVSNFASIAIAIDLVVEASNMYYVAPTFPPSNGKVRYWRLVISDPSNPATYIQIGTILFGTAVLFSKDEAFLNPITQGFKHFKDAVNTEGFTNVMNDRALKRFVKLQFQSLKYFNNNYQKLQDMMTTARTSLKVLVLPTPEFPSRFAIYGKLIELPSAEHQSITDKDEYVTISLEWDESL